VQRHQHSHRQYPHLVILCWIVGNFESGEYASSSEVIREALRDWKLKRSLQQNELAELRSPWHDGLASGPGRLADMNAIKRKHCNGFCLKTQSNTR